MFNKYKVSILLSLLLAVSFAYADTSNPIPADLMFNGQPIDSLCFFKIASNTNTSTIDLSHCGAVEEKYSIIGKNAKLSKQGFIGYEWIDPSLPPGPRGHSYYQYFNAENNKYWIYTINSGGGTGEFSAVSLVKRKNAETLVVEDLMGGDRCNGGIQDVAAKNNVLAYSVNLTAYDFVMLGRPEVREIKAYDDLAACAICCVAKAYYTSHAAASAALTSIELVKYANSNEMPEQGKYQACFNRLFISYIDKNEAIFDQTRINAFVERFKRTCTRHLT